ncbi:MAG: glucose-6-phosphate isomerase, partial [Candidatus Scalindua sp.]|nr:glucose-6-phosphate isomerase [Candidatus Scalindua sp.]
MLKKTNPTQTQSWKDLVDHFEEMKSVHMKDLFAGNSERFNKYSIRFNDIFVDYSKNIITEETLRLLLKLADDVGLRDALDKMFTGERINETEDRAVLHTALRNRINIPVCVNDKDAMP